MQQASSPVSARAIVGSALILLGTGGGPAITGRVVDEQKISPSQGGFGAGIDPGDRFGESVAALGDPDGDGRCTIAVGSLLDDDGGPDRGAVWLLELEPDGTVASKAKISATRGGFAGLLDDGDRFGESLATLGDLDGDGIVDLAVGASRDDDGGSERGAVWILFLNSDGTVKAEQKISDTQGGFLGGIDDDDWFGFAVAALEDLDGDGVRELAVGCRNDDDGGMNRGAVWILFLRSDGTVEAHQKISSTQGGFGGSLANRDLFGSGLASLGDLDGDGLGDLAVGAHGTNDTGPESGAVWIVLLDVDGTVKNQRKISGSAGGFTGFITTGDEFGRSLSARGDLDGDGVPDVAVGAPNSDDGGPGRGAQWILFLNANGTVKAHSKISDLEGGFDGVLQDGDAFGRSSAWTEDLDGDGVGDLVVAAKDDQDGGPQAGAVWVLFLEGVPRPRVYRDVSGFQPRGP